MFSSPKTILVKLKWDLLNVFIVLGSPKMETTPHSVSQEPSRERITFLYLVAMVFRGQTNVQLDFTSKARCSTCCQQETADISQQRCFLASKLVDCTVGRGYSNPNASCFPLLNSLMFLSVHFLNLLRSLWITEGPLVLH